MAHDKEVISLSGSQNLCFWHCILPWQTIPSLTINFGLSIYLKLGLNSFNLWRNIILLNPLNFPLPVAFFLISYAASMNNGVPQGFILPLTFLTYIFNNDLPVTLSSFLSYANDFTFITVWNNLKELMLLMIFE